MHTCPPPISALEEWLTTYDTIHGRYGHLLLEQSGVQDQDLLDALRPYFESAHLDAREYFHVQMGISLHPDAGTEGAHAEYPGCLPSKALRGLFGEVMAGMLTQAYQRNFVGGHSWSVPVFLFRMHADVEQYLFTLARDQTRTRQVFGRHGSDFIGISINAAGEVTRFIAGEAKWRQNLSDSAVAELMHGKLVKDPATGRNVVDPATGEKQRDGRGIWFEINRDTSVPSGLRQLQRILESRDPDGQAATVVSLDKALTLQNPSPLARTNLVLLAGNRSRLEQTSVIDWQQLPAEYQSRHDLQVVELLLTGASTLVEDLYASLWED